MGEVRRKRPWLAVLLALVISGLGHAYLRRWRRAFGWYVAITLTLVFIVPDATVDQLIAGNQPPIVDLVPVLLVIVTSVIDVYVLAIRNNREYERQQVAGRAARTGSGASDAAAPTGADGSEPFPTDGSGSETVGEAAGGAEGSVPVVDCPNCGREVDAELDFCHWCTEELPWAEGYDE